MNLINYLNNNITLNENLKDDIQAITYQMNVKKGQMIINPKWDFTRKLAHKIYFFEKGIFRTFYIKENKKITYRFFDEDSFYCSIKSKFSNSKFSEFGLEALEDGSVSVFNYSEFLVLSSIYKQLELVNNNILSDSYADLQDILYCMKDLNASERYNEFIMQFPDITLRVPLGYIASYLGITQQTLSIIRSSKIKSSENKPRYIFSENINR
jgi:hypothetical protein